MSIAHELSSDVAAAMLARQETEPQRSARDLACVLTEVHATLRQLTAEARRSKARRRKETNTARTAEAAAGAAAAE